MAFQRNKPAAIGIKAPFPGFIEPALASSIEKVPNGDRWIVSRHAVRSGRWAYRIVAMLEAVTAFFGVMRAVIFIAHAIDGYRSRL
jgi:bifunctional non-homologous end joining protein LigD